MIELTQEQWRAITTESETTVIEPATNAAYVVIPKVDYDKQRKNEAEVALALRLAWMRRMRLDEDEIAESIRDEPPVSVQDEMKQVKALDNLDRITPTGEVLKKFAIKY